MKEKHISEYLIAFLRKERVLTRFRKNIDPIFPESYPCNSISGAFAWEFSPEGHEFWRAINQRFV